MIKNLFFDLDGTLTDPSEGIINCIVYALDKLNIKSPARDSMLRFIGPPLVNSFMELLSTEDKEEAQNAVNIYRERFSVIGLYENKPYTGTSEMLNSLASGGYRLFLCTSKPQIFARRILNHFSLDSYFCKVYGSALDGTHVEKASLMNHLLRSENLNADESAMIGDRIYDIDGAFANNVAPYAVSYGFGSNEEFRNALKVFDSPVEIENFFRNGTDVSGNTGITPRP